MAAAMTGLKDMLSKMNAFTETVNAAAAAEQQAKDAQLAAEATEIATLAGMVEAAFLVAAADGSFSGAESDKLTKAFNAAAGDRFGDDFLQTLVDGAASRKEAEGGEARIKDLANILSGADLRRATIALASGIAWLDRGVGEKEGLVLQAMARAFDMPIIDMQRILGESKKSVS
ncbi:MAG: hypothetical protein WKG00_16415 [Polyangiaceae bacterium]